jgi:hypothetical protein
MRSSVRLLVALASVLVLLVACDGPSAAPAGSGLRVEGAWARPAAAGEASAVYLTIQNNSPQPDALVAVECSIAADCMLHETTIAGDVVHMQHLARLEIPAGGAAALEPGGSHIMLTGLEHALDVDDRVEVTLVFELAGEIVIEAEVRAP